MVIASETRLKISLDRIQHASRFIIMAQGLSVFNPFCISWVTPGRIQALQPQTSIPSALIAEERSLFFGLCSPSSSG